MKQPYISIVIPSYNGATTIGNCLESLKHQSYPAKKIEIIVVDDGSTDSTVSVVDTYGVHMISLPHNQGRSVARNEGWRASKGEIVLFTDDDCIAATNWVEQLVAQFKSDVIAVGGRIVATHNKTLGERYLTAMGYGNPAPAAYGKSKNPFQRFLAYLSSMFKPSDIQTKPSLAQAIYTANAAYRIEAIDAMKGFDSYLKTSEDTDLATRVKAHFPNKSIIFEPNAVVSHSHEASIWKFAVQTFHRASNTLDYYRKENKFPPIYPIPILILAVLLLCIFVGEPWLAIITLVFGPIILYPWWLIRVIREQYLYALIFAHCQFLCESAEVAGLIVGLLKVKMHEIIS